MQEKQIGKLNRRTKAIAILGVGLFFMTASILSLRFQPSANEVIFTEKDIEVKEGKTENGAIVSDAVTAEGICKTKPFILPDGNYKISLTYASTASGEALVQGNNDCVFTIDLPATGGEDTTILDERLILPAGTDKGCISFSQKEDGSITIREIKILSDTRIHRDSYAFIALFFAISVTLVVLILLFNRLKFTRVSLIYILLFLGALILVCIPFCTKGTYYEVDTQGHMKRIEALAQGLRSRQIPVIIGPNYANHYGELTILQPGLFLYIPAILRLFKVSVPMSYNIYMILVNIATAVAALVCGERFFSSLRWGIVASVLYLINPFRLYVMMDLGAGAGMGTALIFLPFLIVGLHETMDRGGIRWKYIAVALWGMASSHVLGFVLSAITIVLYLLFHLKQLKNKTVFFALVKAALLFAVMTVGVLAPFIGYYFTDWNRSALQWTDFYHYGADWDRELINLISIAILFIALIGMRGMKHLSRFGRGIFVVGIVSNILALNIFPWILFKPIPFIDSFLSMVQYPFRFHFLTVVSTAFIAAQAICSNMDSRTKRRRKVLWSITVLLGIGIVINFYDYYTSEKLFYSASVGEINTVMEDYLPEGTQTEWYQTDTGEFSDYDAVQAYSYSKHFTNIDCTYTASSDGQYMEFPLFWYPGYTAFDQNGRPLLVEKGEKNRVRVYLTRSDDPQELHLYFHVSRIYKLLFVFSCGFCALFFAYYSVSLAIHAWRSNRITVNGGN